MQEFVLIIEDERLVAENIAAILKQAGLPDSFISDNLTEARQFFQTHNICLILSDININGQLIGPQIVKELLKIKRVPLIYLTAYSEGQVLEDALVTKPQAYVLKPFTERQLLVAVKMALKAKPEEKSDIRIAKPSSREQEIISLLAPGLNSKLFLSEHTVNTHRRNLLRRYILESSSELIALSVRNKWIRL